MTVTVQSFQEFISAEVPQQPHLVDPLIPSSGITLIHGPAGAGKSALGFHLVSALARGAPFLGISTVKTSALYINLEMPLLVLQVRLKNAGFGPQDAYLINHPPVDLLQPSFRLTPEFSEIRRVVHDLNIGCVVIDNAGTLTAQSTSDDQTARGIIAFLRDWFDDRAVCLIHHDRKLWRNPQTGELVNSDEDASGSKYWINSSVSVIHVYKTNGEVRVMKHTKSQAMAQLQEPVKFVLGDDGIKIELWDRKKGDEAAAKLTSAELELRQVHQDWDEKSETEKVQLIAQHLNTTTRTVWRWKRATNIMKEEES